METPILPKAPSAGFKLPPMTTGNIIGLASAAAVIVGAFLPWMKIMGFLSVSGFDGDGKFTLVAGLIGLAALLVEKIPTWVAIVMGLIVVGIMGYDYSQIADAESSMGAGAEDNPFAALATVSLGIGAYLTALGGIGLIVGPIIEMKKGKKTSLPQ